MTAQITLFRFMDYISLIVGIVVGGAIGYLIAKLTSSSTVPVEQNAPQSTQELRQAEQERDHARQEAATLSGQMESYKEEKIQLELKLAEERDRNDQMIAANSDLKARYGVLNDRLEKQTKELEELQQKFTTEFENIANKILDQKAEKFTEQNKTNLETILNPLKERIQQFEKSVETTNKESISQHAALKEQLQSLKDLNRQMSDEAQNLVKALKGDNKAQGNWGEVVLESVLERSGLQKGREYLVQESFVTESGQRRQPDVIVNLPDDKKIIIDSKVSLTDYERLVSSEDQEERNIHLKAFVNSVKRHVKDLSEKRYETLYNTGSLDFVLMFIPIEPAFSMAIQYGEDLYTEAYNKNIIIVSPTTLLATLRTIANIWKNEYQNQNVLEIARQSGALYDKFEGLLSDLVGVGQRMDQAKKSYEGAMNKLVEGRGNLINRVETIKKLGAKTTKSLPDSLVKRAEEGAQAIPASSTTETTPDAQK